jgi:hypothetical protein
MDIPPPCSYGQQPDLVWDELMVGDLNKNSLEEIWNSSLTGKLRGDLAGGARSGVCSNGCCTFEGQV